ncbi:hypothetical protein GQ53DRAFT_837679 [Thozetella sp. PMI_491]|nr:hypothetical protein GQ53DRAFT_837679 [Thozetella sp. PMI_491]
MASFTSGATVTHSSTGGGTATVTAVATTLSPAFFGWTSVGVQSGTTVYSSANCAQGYSFYASDKFATCCATGAGNCPLFTGCAQNTLVGAHSSTICGLNAVCQTGIIHAVAPESTSQVIFCTTAAENSLTFYRALPTPGLVYSAGATGSPLTSGSGSIILGAGAIAGVVIAGVVMLLGCCGLVFCCRKLSRRDRVAYTAEPIPMTAREQRREREREAQQEYWRHREEDIQRNRDNDLAYRLNHNN